MNNSKNHVKNVRNSIQIKHSMSSRSLNEFTKDIPSSATTGSTTTKSNTQTNPSSSKVGNTSGSTRTSIIKASPSLKALESILNEKNKQYNTTNTNIIEEVEEETEETEKVGIAKNHSQDFIHYHLRFCLIIITVIIGNQYKLLRPLLNL